MQANFCCRWLLVGCLVVSPFFVAIHARRGGGGSRVSSSRPSSSYSRPSPSYSRPSPSYSRPSPSYSRPSPSYSRPVPAPALKPAPAPAPRPIPAPAPPAPSYSQTAPKPAPPVIDRQPAYNPNFMGPNTGYGVGDRQPAYNPNYKPDNNRPVGPPPPYSPVGQPVPNAPVGPPPPYQSSSQIKPQQSPPYRGPPTYPGVSSSFPAQPGSHLYPKQMELNRPYIIQVGNTGLLHSHPPKPYPVQPGFSGSHQPKTPKPYPVQPGYSGSHQPNTPKPYPVQPGYSGSHQPNTPKPYPVQPGYSGSHQPKTPKPYPVQPGLSGPHQPKTPKPYPVQPGHSGSHQPNVHKPYPVQPSPHPVANRPYPPQTLGGNVWQSNYGSPAPSYMNYGGIPTGTNMHIKPHKKKGFIGSLMTLGKKKSDKKNKYYGSYPSPYAIGSTGKVHEGDSFLGKHSSSAAMYSIFPYMAAKKAHKKRKPKFGFLPAYGSRNHYHHYYHRDSEEDIDPEYALYFNVYDDKYVGKCQRPIEKKHSKVNCTGNFDELQCIAKCEEGYKFPNETRSLSNKCWHVTGVWKPMKNFPDCMPICNNKCLNGGKCIAPDVCKCPAEYRGSLCQFHFLNCNILKLIKDENLRWVCMHHKNETICQVRCKATTDFDFTPPTEYRCTPDGVWKPNTLPQCETNKK